MNRSGIDAWRHHAAADSKRRAARNLARSHAALSGKWPEFGRPSELRTKAGQDDDRAQGA
jgi:hypothetical protein